MDTDKPVAMQDKQPAEMPETMVINGVTYVRKSNLVDQRVNEIRAHQEVAARTGLTLHQVYFMGTGQVLP